MANSEKLLIIDVDGTLTDGGIYYDENGNELKKFCTTDAAGFFAAHQVGYKIMILTGRECFATQRRMSELHVDYFQQNIRNKEEYLVEFVEKNGYSVLREFQGHGIGRSMHEDPGIPNYGKAGRGIRLEPGMTLAIEPMVIMGRNDIYQDEDGWTILTDDGSLSAHYENTVIILPDGPEILTLVK